MINNKKVSTKDIIVMILSSHIDYGSEAGGLISGKKFDSIAKDIELFVVEKIEQMTATFLKVHNATESPVSSHLCEK